MLHVLSTAGHEVARDDPMGVALAIHEFVRGNPKSKKRITAELMERMKAVGSKL